MGHKGKRRASKEVHVSLLKEKQDSSGHLYHRRSLPLSIQYSAGFIPIGLLFILRAAKQITHPMYTIPFSLLNITGEPLIHVLSSFLHAFY